MFRSPWSLAPFVFLLAITSISRAQDTPGPHDPATSKPELPLVLPDTPPPQFGIAVIRDGMLEIKYSESVPVWSDLTLTTSRVVDGKTVKEDKEFKQCRHDAKPVTASWPINQYYLYRNGQAIGIADHNQLLAQPTRVVFIEGGAPDEFFLSLLNANTIVIAVDPRRIAKQTSGNAEQEPKAESPSAAPNPEPETAPEANKSGKNQRWYRELLFFVATGANVGEDNGHGLRKIQLDLRNGVAYVSLGRAVTAPQGWNKFPLDNDEYDLSWGGHFGEVPSLPAPIRLDATHYKHGQPPTKTTLYFALADRDKAPRLTLTTDPKQAAYWNLEIIDRAKTGTENADREYAGYVYTDDIPNHRYWFDFSTTPLLTSELVMNPEPRVYTDNRLLTLSDKKNRVFRYVRHVPDGR